jgi:23S rRNA (uracil1939-C5)-methyltransferase
VESLLTHVSVAIEKLVDGGAGLARIDGQVVFVPGVCPGETVTVRVTAVKSGYAEAQLEAVLTPSPDRVTPPCPVAGRCGGCQWQQLDYPAQLRAKVDILRENLRRMAKLDEPNILPSIAAPSPFDYRTRIQLKIDGEPHDPLMGFYAPKSNRIVPIDGCLVAAPPLNRAVAALRTLLAAPSTRMASLTEVHLQLAQGTGELQFRYFTEGEPKKRVETFLAGAAKALPELVSQVYYDRSGHRRVLGRDWITDRINDRPFRISDRSFAQVNWEQNLALIETVKTFAALSGRESLLELYCGIGNFGLFLAEKASGVMGIDENEIAIKDAIHNAQQHGVANCRFVAKPVEEAVAGLVKGKRHFDCIIVDPPREGIARAVVQSLIDLKPSRLIYISCAPATLARDLKHLIAGGYRPERIQPIDLFPQTFHLETVTELTLV